MKANSKIVPADELKTFDFGTLEGKKQTADENKRIHENIINNPDDKMHQEGESFNGAYGRIVPKMSDIIENAPANTAVVTHNSVYGLIKLWDKENRPEAFDRNQREKYTKQDNKFETGEHFTIQGKNGPIHVVRHGETKDNVAHNFRTSNTELTGKGVQEARKLGKTLGKHDIPQVISSPLPRAMHTSNLILGEQPKKNFRSGGWLDNYGEEENANEGKSSGPAGSLFSGTTDKGRDYSPAWGGQFAMGGSIPGTVGHTYSRDGAPSNGKYAKATMASAQDGLEVLNTRQKRGIELQLKERQNALKDEIELHKTGNIKNPRSVEYYQKIPKREEVRTHVPQTKWEKAKQIAINPLTAAGYVARGEDIPDRFQFGPRNTLDTAIDYVNPAQSIEAVSNLPGQVARGQFMEAGLGALSALDLIPVAKGVSKVLKSPVTEGIAQGVASRAMSLASPTLENIAATSKRFAPGLTDRVTNIGPFLGDLKQNYQLTKANLGKIKQDFGADLGERAHEFKDRALAPLASNINTLDDLKQFHRNAYYEMHSGDIGDVDFGRKLLEKTTNDSDKFRKAYFDPNLTSQDYKDAAQHFLESFPSEDEIVKLGKEKAKTLRKEQLVGQDPKGTIRSFMDNLRHGDVETPDLSRAEESTINAIRELGKYKEIADYSGTRKTLLTNKDAMTKVRNLVEGLDDDVVQKTLGIPKSDIIQSYDQIKTASDVVKQTNAPIQVGRSVDLLPQDKIIDYYSNVQGSALDRLGTSIKEKLVKGYKPLEVADKEKLIGLAVSKYDVEQLYNPITGAYEYGDKIIEQGNTRKQLIGAIKKVEGAPKGTHFIGSDSLSSDSYPLTLEAGLSAMKRGNVEPNFSRGQQHWNSMGFLTQFPDLSVKEINQKIREIEKIGGKKIPRATVGPQGEMILPNIFFTRKQYGGVIRDNRGQWAYPGMVTQIDSNNITMKKVDYPVIGLSDVGDLKLMKPGRDYKFKGNSVTEFPIAKDGSQLVKLDQLTNFTNYNTPQPGGWLDKL